MYIKELHIDSFAALKDVTLDFSKGLNIIEGENESGKSSVAMFIKFMMYGLSGRTSDGEMSERKHYLSWDSGSAAGYMIVVSRSGEYRIERSLSLMGDAASGVRERVAVIDTATGETVMRDGQPGEELFGIPESVFVNTVFVRQSGGKVDGDGLCEAIENILLSGDESISTKKAADALEKQRKALRYKGGRSGGRIYELEREEARLSALLANAAEKSSEIIALESSIEEMQKVAEQRQRDADHYTAVSDAYEKLSAAARVDSARRCRAEIARLDSALAQYTRYGNISEATAKIHRLRGQISDSEANLRDLRRREADLDRQLPKEMSQEAADRLRGDVRAAKRASSGAAVLRVFAVLFILAAAGTAAAIVLLPDILSGMYRWAAAGAGALALILSVIFFAAGAAKAKKYKSLLREWDAGSISALSDAVEEHIKRSGLRSDPSSEYYLAAENVRKAEEEKDALTAELRSACSVFCDAVPDTDIFCENALEAAADAERELQNLRQTRREWQGRLEGYREILGDDDGTSLEAEAAELLNTDEGLEARKLDPAGARETAHKARFAQGTLPSLNTQLREKTAALGQLRGGSADPCALAAELDSVRREKDELCEKYDAVVCALDALQTAGENLRHSLMPRIVSEAGEIMQRFTGGKYSRLGIERNFDMTFEYGGRTHDAAYFSAGTADAAYISLRCALLKVLFENDAPPAIYDESFARTDEERLRRILSLLADGAGRDLQSIVFTCRSLEADIAGADVRAKVTKL